MVVGDLSGCSQNDLAAAQARVGPLVLAVPAVRRVVDSLRSGTISPEVAQAWASFMRRGYIATGAGGAVRPIDIEFEQAAESEIAEVVARLDEIGDAIDGEIGASELADLARRLNDE